MVSSSQMYWILMLDNIRFASGILTPIMLLVIISCAGMATEEKKKEKSKQEDPMILVYMTALSFIILLASIASLIFVPTTKQAAVIYIAPKVLSEQNVTEFTGEMKELYTLGKDYLKEALKKDKQEAGK